MLYISDIQREGFKGLFTADPVKSGETILELDGSDIVNSPSRTSIEIGHKLYLEDDIGKYINHSCKPNARIDRENLRVVATRDINVREEITFDYRINESNILFPFVCKCCGQYIK